MMKLSTWGWLGWPGWLGVVLCLLLVSCDTQERQSEFVDAASLPASGIARTDADGIILEDDQDDWRTSPVYGGKIRFDPAYPNPVASDFVTLPITILEFNAIQGGLVLRARDANGRLRTLDDIQQAADPGVYVFMFSPSILARTGLIRLFVFDRLGELVSYGDIEM